MKYVWTIHVRPDQHAAFYDNWAAWTNILARHPDAQGATCYRTAYPDTYLVIAEWVSKQARDEATAAVEAIPWWDDNDRYGTVTDLGWLEETVTDWTGRSNPVPAGATAGLHIA